MQKSLNNEHLSASLIAYHRALVEGETEDMKKHRRIIAKYDVAAIKSAGKQLSAGKTKGSFMFKLWASYVGMTGVYK